MRGGERGVCKMIGGMWCGGVVFCYIACVVVGRLLLMACWLEKRCGKETSFLMDCIVVYF